MARQLPHRLTVGPQTLNLFIGVRIPVWQPSLRGTTMQFPNDIFDVTTNMPASEFLQVYNDLRSYDRSLVADISRVEKTPWFLNYNGHRYEFTANNAGTVDAIYRR